MPGAEVVHDYTPDRAGSKRYLVERNRLITVLTVFETRTILAVLPLLLAAEVAIFGLACWEGWAMDKVRGWGWLARHTFWLRGRRREVQAARRRPDVELLLRLSPRISADYLPLPSLAVPIDGLVGRYWTAWARRATVTNSL